MSYESDVLALIANEKIAEARGAAIRRRLAVMAKNPPDDAGKVGVVANRPRAGYSTSGVIMIAVSYCLTQMEPWVRRHNRSSRASESVPRDSV